MARGKTLGYILNSLRAELRLSLNVAQNPQVRDTHVIVLQRIQEMLADDYDWPILKVDRYLQPQAGQRFYDPATVLKINNLGEYEAANDLRVDRIESVWLRDGDYWRELCAGIPPEAYNDYDSDTDQRSWPPQRWRIAEGEQIEIWPVPDIDGDTTEKIDMLKIIGVRNLSAFTQDSDTADLDDRLIVLMAAAELLDGEPGQKKATLAQRRLLKVRGNQSVIRQFRMFGTPARRSKLRGPPTVYYRTDS